MTAHYAAFRRDHLQPTQLSKHGSDAWKKYRVPTLLADENWCVQWKSLSRYMRPILGDTSAPQSSNPWDSIQPLEANRAFLLKLIYYSIEIR